MAHPLHEVPGLFCLYYLSSGEEGFIVRDSGDCHGAMMADIADIESVGAARESVQVKRSAYSEGVGIASVPRVVRYCVSVLSKLGKGDDIGNSMGRVVRGA